MTMVLRPKEGTQSTGTECQVQREKDGLIQG